MNEKEVQEKNEETYSVETSIIRSVVASDPHDDDPHGNLEFLDRLGNSEGLPMVRRVDVVSERAEEDVVGRGWKRCDGLVDF